MFDGLPAGTAYIKAVSPTFSEDDARVSTVDLACFDAKRKPIGMLYVDLSGGDYLMTWEEVLATVAAVNVQLASSAS